MNFLSKNMRYLRKQHKLSQQQFADALGIKRSNIAAYETKNVEPRLSLIHQMANFFEVTLADLVITDLTQQLVSPTQSIGSTASSQGSNEILSTKILDDLKQHNGKIQRMLEGFKVFYEYKKGLSIDGKGHEGDIDNFLVFIDHMLEYNRMVENLLYPDRQREGGMGHLKGHNQESVVYPSSSATP